LDEIKNAIEGPSLAEVLKFVWERLESQTVDYGIMEKAKRVVVLPANNLGWIDIGSWDRMFEVLEPDDSGNIVISDSSLLMNTTGSMVVTGDDKRLIALLGVKDLVVVDAGNVLLVCNRDHAEDVRKIVQMLSEQGKDIYL
jgi:mannose-1-phosphate guanylyltransferase